MLRLHLHLRLHRRRQRPRRVSRARVKPKSSAEALRTDRRTCASKMPPARSAHNRRVNYQLCIKMGSDAAAHEPESSQCRESASVQSCAQRTTTSAEVSTTQRVQWSAQLSSAQLSSAQLSSAQLSSAQLSSAQLRVRPEESDSAVVRARQKRVSIRSPDPTPTPHSHSVGRTQVTSGK